MYFQEFMQMGLPAAIVLAVFAMAGAGLVGVVMLRNQEEREQVRKHNLARMTTKVIEHKNGGED